MSNVVHIDSGSSRMKNITGPPSFEVTPVQDIEQELRALAIRFDYELSSEEYKKAELLEIEGLPYDKKYLLPPRVKWTL